MGSGKVAPAPVRAVPCVVLEPLELVFLLLHAPATRATTSSAAGAAATLWTLLMRPPCSRVRIARSVRSVPVPREGLRGWREADGGIPESPPGEVAEFAATRAWCWELHTRGRYPEDVNHPRRQGERNVNI